MMDIYTCIATVPTVATVETSPVSGQVRLKIDTSIDVYDRLCDIAAEELHTNGVYHRHPTVHMCCNEEYAYLDITNLRMSRLTTRNVYSGVQLRCDIIFRLRCNIPDGDDTAIDRVVPTEILRIF